MAERTAGKKAATAAAKPVLQSMTGFARTEDTHDGARWAWEVKSVNARNLDIRMRLPNGHEGLEPRARVLASERFGRGNLSVHLALRRVERTPNIRVNEAILEKLIAIHNGLRARLDAPPARLEALMSLPGVLEILEDEEGEDQRAERHETMMASLTAALDALAESRREEGLCLGALIQGHLIEIAATTKQAGRIAAGESAIFRARVHEQLKDLLGADPPLSEDRLTQEVAYLASRADIREEIDRLDAHVIAARKLIASGGPVGRKLDFLCQEFNREANTLCSKSSNLDLTRLGLDLKAAIERLREQVQNLE